MSCPATIAFSTAGTTLSEKPMIPGRMPRPAASRSRRFARSSSLTVRLVQPVARSSAEGRWQRGRIVGDGGSRAPSVRPGSPSRQTSPGLHLRSWSIRRVQAGGTADLADPAQRIVQSPDHGRPRRGARRAARRRRRPRPIGARRTAPPAIRARPGRRLDPRARRSSRGATEAPRPHAAGEAASRSTDSSRTPVRRSGAAPRARDAARPASTRRRSGRARSGTASSGDSAGGWASRQRTTRPSGRTPLPVERTDDPAVGRQPAELAVEVVDGDRPMSRDRRRARAPRARGRPASSAPRGPGRTRRSARGSCRRARRAG